MSSRVGRVPVDWGVDLQLAALDRGWGIRFWPACCCSKWKSTDKVACLGKSIWSRGLRAGGFSSRLLTFDRQVGCF